MTRPEFGVLVDQNYNCDSPLHGYGCFHLDNPKQQSKLNEKDQKRFGFLQQRFSMYLLEEVEEEIDEVQSELDRAEERVAELSDDIDELHEFKRLWEKSGLPEDLSEEKLSP